MTLRVLVVARWYPSYDDPRRGSFVADLIEALIQEGVAVTVASWDYALYGGALPPAALDRATTAWDPAVRRPVVLNTPTSWGAGVPVARLPALHTAKESLRRKIDAHAAILEPFGVALHQRWPFDVIHAHTGLPDGVAATRLGRAVGVPVMVTEHDRTLRERLPGSAEARAAYRGMLDEAALTVAVSTQYRDLLCKALAVPASAIDVLPNALPAAFFSVPLDAPRDPDELLYVGGRKENKGMPTLLEAFALTWDRHPTLRLRLIGQSESEEDERRWHGLAEGLGIAGSVTFEPPGDRVAVARAMTRAGVFVHPSPFESFGMVAAEALAAGMPIAATPSGIEEIVGTDGTHGEIAAGHDAAALHQAIERVLERRSHFVPETQRGAVARFEASNVARETIARYRAAIDAHPGRRTPEGPRPRRPAAGEIGGAASAEASRRGTFRAPLVIGLNRRLAQQRLGALPAQLRAILVLATRTTKGSDQTGSPVGRVIEIDLEREYRARLAALGAPPGVRWNAIQRAWHFVRSPGAALARRRLRQDPQRFLDTAAQRLILEAWTALLADDEQAPALLALDLNDVLGAELVVAHGGQLMPGGTRWLADRWDESTSSQ